MKFEDYVRSEDALFHYTKKSILFEYIIPSMKLRLSPINKTNDPKEYKEWYYNEVAIGGNASFNSKKKFEAQTKLNDLRLQKSKVACFCSNIDYYDEFNIIEEAKRKICGYEKSRMWSQYGEEHSGICLVFSKEELEKILDTITAEKIKSFKDIMDYRIINLSDFPIIEINKLNRKGVEKYCEEKIQNEQKTFFFTKDEDYKDESEFRIVILSENEDYFFIDIAMCLKGIIVGDKFPEVYHSLLLQISNEKNIEIRKLTYSKGNYLPLRI
ncbi:MAG: DUF2971 domain-containing protein [Candidatus Tenebribacter davisii]|jgi:hypothetical protein|nr:DUF2971 domain-containing protein [Candidatus Tenebribacter davisii]